MGGVRRLYVLHHFVMGVILFGETSQVSRQSLKTVSIDDYEHVYPVIEMITLFPKKCGTNLLFK